MQLFIYAYFDQKIKAFTQPIFDSNTPEVVLEGLARNISSGNAKFPYKDLSLYCLGIYNDKTGFISAYETANLLGHLIEFAPAEVTSDDGNQE